MITILRRDFEGGTSCCRTTRLAVFWRRLMAAARPAAVFGRRGVVILARYRPRQENPVGFVPVVVIDHIGDDDRDVVGTASAQRQFDEAVPRARRRRQSSVLRGWSLARIRQPVRAQRVAVAFARFAHDRSGFDFMSRECAHDRRGAGDDYCFFGSDATLVDGVCTVSSLVICASSPSRSM